MARIHGINPGLVPRAERRDPTAPPPPRERKKETLTCTVCAGEFAPPTPSKFPVEKWRNMTGADIDEPFLTQLREDPVCKYCVERMEDTFFPSLLTRELVKERIPRAMDSGWGLILRTGVYGDNGGSFTVEIGDIVKVERAGVTSEHRSGCSDGRTKAAVSATVRIGPYDLVLFAHEFSPIPFFEVMAMRKAGEITEQFVSADDEVGYFAPTPGMRAMIENAFGDGSRIGAPIDFMNHERRAKSLEADT